MEERYLNPQELLQYEDSVNAYRDIVNAINTAKKDSFAEGRKEGREEGRKEGREEGREEGRKEGRVEGRKEGIAQGLAHVAKTMLDNGMDIQTISQMTGLPVSAIEDIIKKKK